MTSNYAMSNESYNPNPFTPPPAAAKNSLKNNDVPNMPMLNNQRYNRQQNIDQVAPAQINPVTQVLTEKEIRTNKILEAINGKMLNAKNIPIENSRYVGVINGKRIYQNIETNEYVKVDIENN